MFTRPILLIVLTWALMRGRIIGGIAHWSWRTDGSQHFKMNLLLELATTMNILRIAQKKLENPKERRDQKWERKEKEGQIGRRSQMWGKKAKKLTCKMRGEILLVQKQTQRTLISVVEFQVWVNFSHNWRSWWWPWSASRYPGVQFFTFFKYHN